MRIGHYLNTTKEDIEAKKYNICFGFSLGNKYFTPDNIRSYIIWGLENTKNRVAIIIPDKIQAINYEVKNDYSPKRALAVALRKGEEIEKIVRNIIEELKIPESKIRVLHWKETEDDSYIKTLKIITTAFEHNTKFRKMVVQMVKETPHLGSLNFLEHQYEKLAQYIVNELPVLINGLNIDNVHYELFPYPGFANLDYLALDLQEGKTFPEITAQLNVQEKLRLLELYVD